MGWNIKKNEKIGKYPTAVSILIAVLICAMCTAYMVQLHYLGKATEQVYAEDTKPLEQIKSPDDMGAFTDDPEYENRQPFYKKLHRENDHTVGWIYIDGTKVDNVLMQSKEEKDFYIDKGFDREYFYPGTLYISDISDLVKPTDVIIMYGHNMKDRSMFGSLREFEDPEFLKKHDKITVDNLENRKEYEITHVMRIRVNVEGGDDFPYYTYSDFKDEEDYNAFIDQCNGHSLYDSGKTTEYGDRFVMLTTCEYTYSDGTGRLVIMGKELQPEPEPTEEAITTEAEPEKSVPIMNIILIVGGILLLILIILIVCLTKFRSRRAD